MLVKYIYLFILGVFFQACGSEIEVTELGEIAKAKTLEVRVDQLSTQVDPTKSNNIYFKVKFSNPIEAESFQPSDIIQEGSSKGVNWELVHFSDGTDYFLIGTGEMTRGTLRPRISAGSVVNFRGVRNSESVSEDNTVLYNPSFGVQIEQSISETVGTCTFNAQDDPVAVEPIEFKVSFSEVIDPVSFDSSDIFQSGGAEVGIWNITNCGDNKNFKLEASSITGMGIVQPTLLTGSIVDSDLNQNEESSANDNQVEFKLSEFIWTGSVDNNWNTPGNWLNNTVPGNLDIAIFSDSYCSNCNANLNVSSTISGLILDANYTGILQFDSSVSLDINGDLVQRNGQLNLGNSTLRLVGDAELLASNFDAGTSSFLFVGDGQQLSANGVEFYNFDIRHSRYLGDSTLSFNGTINILNDLYITKSSNTTDTSLSGGQINLEGNLHVEDSSYYNNSVGTPIHFVGNSNQSVTANGLRTIPVIVINKPSGTLSFDNDFFGISGDFQYIQGSVSFKTGNEFSFSGSIGSNIDPGPIEFENVKFNWGGSAAGPIKNLQNDLVVKGDLNITSSNYITKNEVISGSDIYVDGDITITNYDTGNALTSNIYLVGTEDQHLTILDDTFPGNVIVAKPSGEVKQLSNLNFSKTSHSVFIQNGTWNMNGFSLTVSDQLNVGDGVGTATSAILNQGCLIPTSASMNINPTDGNVISSSSNPTIAISDQEIIEGGNLVFNVTFSEPVCASNTNITYVTNNGTATTGNSDYLDNDGTLIISSGSLSGTITIITSADTTMEPDETLNVVLTGTDQGTLGDSSGEGIILNDDDNGFIWTGDAGDNNWFTAANWSGGVVPTNGSGQNILFDGTCNDIPANCDVNLTSNIDVNNVWLESDFPGTITQQVGASVTLNIFTQKSGVFLGSNAEMDFKEFNLFGGDFTATSGTMRVGPYGGFNFNNSDGFIITSGNFYHNNGTVHMNCRSQSAVYTLYNCLVVDVSGSVTLNNLELTAFDTDGRAGYDTAYVSLSNGDTIVVEGNYTVHDGAIRGSGTGISLKGNAIFNCLSGDGGQTCSSSNDHSSLPIIFSGTNPQTYAFQADAKAGSVVIDSSSTVSPLVPSDKARFRSLSINNGTFVAPSGVLQLGRRHPDFHSSNTDGLFQTGGAFDHNNGTVEFIGAIKSAVATNYRAFLVNVSSSIDLYNFILNVEDTDGRVGYSSAYAEISGGDQINVLGEYTIRDGAIYGGLGVFAYGDVNFTCDSSETCANGHYTSSVLTFAGTANQNINQTSGAQISGRINLEKSSGTVSQTSDIDLTQTDSDLYIQNGTWKMNKFGLNIDDQLNIGDGVGSASSAVLKQDCTAPIAGTTNVNTDGLVESSPGNPTIDIADATIIEGGSLEFAVSLSEGVCGSSTNITFTTDDNSAAISDLDYTDNDSTLVIAAGDFSGTITVSTTGDNKVESNETVNINLTSTDQGSLGDSLAVGTIENDDLCPTGFIAVDGNSNLKTETFCVMQFEAKDNAGTAESVASGSPWVNIDAPTAQSHCEILSEGGFTGTFSLISNPEWMTIARNIENNDTNWSGGSVGNGYIARGHSDGVPSYGLAVLDSSDYYDGTGQSSGNQSRVHILSSGEEIWDFSGNIYEWTDWDPTVTGFNLGPTDISTGWKNLNSTIVGSIDFIDYKPSNDSYGITENFGRIFGGSGGATLRGGSWVNSSENGIYTLYLSANQSDVSSQYGFRCVYREQQPPTTYDFLTADLTENVESIITLEYGDYNGDLGSSCNISNLSNVFVSTPCSCDGGGICTVGITGNLNYTGAADFEFAIVDNDGTSESSIASFTIVP